MGISKDTFNKAEGIGQTSVRRFLLLYIAIVLFFVAIGPWIFSSDWVSSSDFHSCIEIISSFIALTAGVACLVFFLGLRNHFFLIVGLGFFISGSEDLIHGIFSFKRLFADTGADFSRFIPGTYVAGRMTLATLIIVALLIEWMARKPKNLKREAIIYSSLALMVGGGFTALAFKIHLPQFIYPDRLISRPVDFVSAILFLIALPLMWRRYAAKRDVFSGMLLASILFNLCGQVYMSFSKQLFDAFFDLAHYANVLSYVMPVLGISLQGLEEMTKTGRELANRKKMEEALRESEAKYRTLYESSRDAIMMIAPPTWKFVAGNQATLELFGVRNEEEFITKGPWDVSPEYQPDGQLSAEKAKDMIEKAMKEGSNFFEWQHKKLDGKEFPATVLLTRVDWEGRELLQATVRDITEYKQALELLLKSETKYRTLIENIPQKVFVKDRNSVYVSCNESYAEALKIKSSDIAGKTDYDFFPKELADKYRADDKRIIESKITDSIEEKYNHHGEEIIINTVKTPVKDEQGNITGLLGIFWDITERKRAEEAIKTAYEQLEQAHSELKETQSQLIQNEKLASIGQLAAGVAHEMNTPVGFVASNFRTLENYVNKFLEMLAGYKEVTELVDTGTKEQRLAKLQEITEIHNKMKIDFILEDIQGLFDDSREGLDRITSIVQNLRDFSRIDKPGSRDEYNINEGIETTLVVARNEIKYDADVKTDFSEVPLIFCHSGQINQVFLNILVNAAQAIKSQEKDDTGAITIRTYTSEDKVICEIADDGPGIPPDKLSKIFDPFFTTKPAGKGTGLGLSVSYDIVVNKHNGELFAESTVGKGTKFTIKLPIGTKENDEQEIMSDEKENSVICGR